ncbi:MAG: hypothetical protein U0821_17350 [Chloroflexota bacterium]
MWPESPLLSPTGLGLAFAWNVTALASLQLTVRLIRAFSLARTALAGAWLTTVSVPVAFGFSAMLQADPRWLPLGMATVGVAGYVVARRVLRIRRQRGAVVAAVGTAILCGPWTALLVQPPR